MRTVEDIARMAKDDYEIGLTAHYKPLAGLINSNGYKSVIEIGTAYGGCAQFILETTDVNNFVSIDPYEYYGDGLGCQMPGLECQQDYDLLRSHALKRLCQHKQFSVIPYSSKKAFDYFKTNPGIFDLVFIDGEHTYDTVLWECENYSQVIRSGGILCGHDWNIFIEVNNAVWEFARQTSKQIKVLEGNIWYFLI